MNVFMIAVFLESIIADIALQSMFKASSTLKHVLKYAQSLTVRVL
jgi:hypothetical protein